MSNCTCRFGFTLNLHSVADFGNLSSSEGVIFVAYEMSGRVATCQLG